MPLFNELSFRNGGDRSLFVEVGDEITPEVNQGIRNLLSAIDKADLAGVKALAPTYRSILVYYDPLSVAPDTLKEQIAGLYGNLEDAELGGAKIVEIPTLYGGEYGPDIDFVASHNGINEAEVVEVHTGSDYLVYMVGFNPGFPYLGGMSEKIATPRLPTPRVRMVPGSVGIAERQTGIYPLASPGGWRVIGRSPIRMFDPGREPPSLVMAGDLVRFTSIDEARYREIEGEVEAGTYKVTTREAG